jgi:hypothetical protein
MQNSKTWVVWVGGTIVNDYFLNQEQAELLAFGWRTDGYDDVCVEDTAGQNQAISGSM